MCKRVSQYFELVEVPVTAAVTRVAIPDQAQLRNMYGEKRISIIDLEVYTVITLAATQNNTTSPLAELKKSTLVLVNKARQVINRIPLCSLIMVNDGTSPYTENPVSFDGLEVDWAQSYVELYTAAANYPYAFMLGVNYKVA